MWRQCVHGSFAVVNIAVIRMEVNEVYSSSVCVRNLSSRIKRCLLLYISNILEICSWAKKWKRTIHNQLPTGMKEQVIWIRIANQHLPPPVHIRSVVIIEHACNTLIQQQSMKFIRWTAAMAEKALALPPTADIMMRLLSCSSHMRAAHIQDGIQHKIGIKGLRVVLAVGPFWLNTFCNNEQSR